MASKLKNCFIDTSSVLHKGLESNFKTISQIEFNISSFTQKYDAKCLGIINNCGNLRYFNYCQEILEFPRIFGTYGLNPNQAKYYTGDVEAMILKLMAHPKVLAWGEIGLENLNFISSKKVQLEVFKRQLSIASDIRKPVVIVSKNTLEETHTIMKDILPREQKIHLQNFSYETEEEYKLIEDLIQHFPNLYIGISGKIFSFPELKSNIVKIPLDRILLESNCPINHFQDSDIAHPGNIILTAKILSDYLNVEMQVILNHAYENTLKCYFSDFRKNK